MRVSRRAGIAVTAGTLATVVGGVVLSRPTAPSVSVIAAQVADHEIRLQALEGAQPSLSASPTVTLPPSPTPIPSATPPMPTQTAVPPTPSPVTCANDLAAKIAAAPAGSTLNLGTCAYTTPNLTIAKALTIVGGRHTIPQGARAFTVTANDVTLDGLEIIGGGGPTVVINADRAKVLRSKFTGMTETTISFSIGADNALIEANSITQTIPHGEGYSPISANDNLPGGGHGVFNGMTVRGNTINQGTGNVSHFGVEVWGVVGLVIENNVFLGDSAQISIPRSDGAIVRNNVFGPGFFWGVELADIENAQVRDNIVHGIGQSIGPDGRAFIQLHPGSGAVKNITISGNRADALWALINAAGSGHTITNNCGGWSKLYAFTFSGAVTISGNGTC